MGMVYIVHCIDTEGPLYEDKGVVFEQIKKIYGIEIENTETNYELLKKGLLDCGENTEGVKNLFRNHKVATKGDWNEIDKMLKEITTYDFRHKLNDSEGRGWIYNWFCMDHVGFWGENPRKRDSGHHKIYDHYVAMVQEQNEGDFIGFHHHPVSVSGNYHDSGTAYWGRDTLNEILARKIIDRDWFPSVYRPGFHTERPDSHWFLEQWIPFDYGNQATDYADNEQIDLNGGRFGDWRYAPKEWVPYHPSHDNYQVKGTCHRWITRCLNMKARVRELRQEDVNEAFKSASEGQDVILAFTDHDYKDMEEEIDKVREMILNASVRYREVRYIYSDALSAMRRVLKLQDEKIGLGMKLDFNIFPIRLIITAQKDIFGPQPFLAIKTKKGRYYWDNLDFMDKNQWSYTFDNNTFIYDDIEVIGVASNNNYGETEILRYDCLKKIYKRTELNVGRN
ncbi:MAG: hypothetical protein NC548_21080 [Lachnospiraceae bacterium]|nr:hypothetical protein [Lachnospiraceae bacterium]